MKHYFLLIVMLVFAVLPVHAESDREDFDIDDDGLIEINDLGDLNAIHYYFDGQSLYGKATGCYPPAAEERCYDFELTRDLDFDTNQNGRFDEGDSFWNGGEGWEPMPLYQTTFEGNGYAIRNLTINRPGWDRQGLFADVIFSSVNNLALINVSITTANASGALVGSANTARFNGIFTTGEISGGDLNHNLGGVIGKASNTHIKNLFSSVNVKAGYFSGAIIGHVGEGTRLDTVLAVSEIDLAMGTKAGLVGSGYGRYINSHMAVDVAGLPYDNTPAQIGSFGTSLNRLKCPVSANDTDCLYVFMMLYKDWPSQNNSTGIYWDFGNTQELPGLVLNGKLYRFDYPSQ